METRNIPSLMIAAPKSGSGKTLLTCGLIAALKERGKNVCSFKCGPDYIDPMFHRTVLGIPSENLDTWFLPEKGVKELFLEAAAGADLAVMEGVMGLFDGAGGIRQEGSSYHLAQVTDTPVVMIFDVHGMGISMVPMIRGFFSYDKEKRIRGIILNRISKGYYERMLPTLQQELADFPEVRLLGYFPKRADLALSSRHLGLVMPDEIGNIREMLHRAGLQMEESVDLEAVLALAEECVATVQSPVEKCVATVLSPIEECAASVPSPSVNKVQADANVRLAVARDEAFCFYYPANLRMLERLGVQIVNFSPLHDKRLPADVDGILLGGGYPENYAKCLAENASMRDSIREALEAGMPSLAECGGFMYLHRTITDAEGQTWPMAGVIPGDITWKGKLVRFGYASIEEKEPTFLPAGSRIRGHEFHYYDSSANGSSCTAVKTDGRTSWDCVWEGEDHFWGFPHLYYPSAPEFAAHFVKQMRRYSDRCQAGAAAEQQI